MHKKFRIEIAVIIFLYAIFSVISLTTLNFHIDEKESHLPTVQTFYDNAVFNAIESKGYKSASTPLPYIIVSTPLKILNIAPSLFAVRFANIIISLITLLIFTQLIKTESKNFIYPLLILFFYPYYLKPSFAFFMSIYGLMFFLIFVYLAKPQSAGYILSAGLSLAAAVLCQQFYLIVFVFYTGYLLYQEYITEPGTKSVIHIFYFILPFVLPIIIFLIWGGLVHPAYSAWGTAFSFSSLTGVLVTLGAVLLPYMAFNIKEIKLRELPVLLIFSLLLAVFAFPLWVNQPTIGGISGITFNFLAKVNGYSSVFSFVLKVLFCFSGISSFIVFFRKADNQKSRFIFLLYIVLAIGFSLNRLPSERHMLPLIVTAYIFIFNRINKNYILKYWLGYQVIIGSVYFYYIMFGY